MAWSVYGYTSMSELVKAQKLEIFETGEVGPA